MSNVTSTASHRVALTPRYMLPNEQPLGTIVPYSDPLDADQETDQSVTMTHRQLARLLFIAAETGGRFEREPCQMDPVAWLFSPRELFDGCTAVQACQCRSHFIRAIILHGLSIGLDADPDEVDSLLTDDGDLSFDNQPATPARPDVKSPVLSPV